MKRLAPVLSVLVLLVACGHVAGNYPPPPKYEPYELPTEYAPRDKSYPLVWQEEGVVHGFLLFWETAAAMRERLHQWEAAGSPMATVDLRRFEPMEEEGYAYACIHSFVAPGREVRIGPGTVRLEFTDGTSAVAEEVYLYGPSGAPDHFQRGSDGLLVLRGKDDPDTTGRNLYVFVPGGTVEKTVRTVIVRNEGSPRESS
jgi:hypothetical protein